MNWMETTFHNCNQTNNIVKYAQTYTRTHTQHTVHCMLIHLFFFPWLGGHTFSKIQTIAAKSFYGVMFNREPPTRAQYNFSPTGSSFCLITQMDSKT